MLFTRIPQQYAPLGGELRYAVSQETAGNIDIRIVDAPWARFFFCRASPSLPKA